MSSMTTPAVRRSLERLLDAAGFHVVSYQSPSAFLNAASGLSAGCVLLDIRMPGVDGLEVQARLNRLRVNLPVIVMTGHGDVPSAVRAMKAGAVDFLEKPFDDETLLNAIGGAFAKASRTHVGDREAVRAAQRIATLSPREREVLDALLAGRPEQGHCLRPQHQRADGRGPSRAYDGAAWNKAVRRRHSSCSDGQVGAQKSRET